MIVWKLHMVCLKINKSLNQILLYWENLFPSILKENEKMKKITLILIFFLHYLVQSQTGIIEYELKIGENVSENVIKDKYIKSANEGASKLNFILEFNNLESQFYLENNLNNNDRDSKLAIAMTDYDNVIYYNSKENIALYNNRDEKIFKKEEFLIKDTIFDRWSFTNETKLIENLLCYKAEGTLTYFEGDREFKKKLTAWYCPELPYPFGPFSYGNLPGLILELNIGEVLFGVKKINISDKNISIKKPIKGKIISRDEYMKIIINRRQNYNFEREVNK